jgi:hypothetical protein
MDGAIAGALRRGAMRPSRECYRQKMILAYPPFTHTYYM